jgi:hypothetical protein
MKTANGVVLLLLVAASLSCDHASPVDSRSSVVPVELVVARPQSYAHQLVTIRGCYFHGYEVSALGSCHDTRRGHVIWVENAELLHSLQHLPITGLPEYLRTSLVFQYDEARNRTAWRKLVPPSASSLSSSGVEVTVTGQFETGYGGYGHMGAYAHQLVLMDVPRRPTAPVSRVLPISTSGHIGYPVRGLSEWHVRAISSIYRTA